MRRCDRQHHRARRAEAATSPGTATVLASAAAAVLVLAAPVFACTVPVGSTTWPTDDDPDQGSASAPGHDAGQIRARGLVVNDLEPPNAFVDTDRACPSEGCAYELHLTDPETVRGDTDGEPAINCRTLDYAVVDAEPRMQEIDQAARVYTGEGGLPVRTADTPRGDTPDRLTPGVGQLCFASPAHDGWRRNDTDDGPLVATQPTPIVILYRGETDSDTAE